MSGSSPKSRENLLNSSVALSPDLSPALSPTLSQANGVASGLTPALHRTVARAGTRALREGRAVSLRDVAKLAEVSVATVSMVLNENPRISRATQMRVQQVIDQTGYQPNRLAQGLSSRYTRVLAVLLPALRHGFGDAYFGEIISGVSEKAQKLGYKIMLEQATREFVSDRKYIEMYERRFVDGILAMGVNDRHPFLADFTDRKYPLIVVDNYFNQSWDLDHVVCNYAQGAAQVMDYLVQLGHKKIGLIHGPTGVCTAADVIGAFEKKQQLMGNDCSASWRQCGYYREEGGAKAAATLLKQHPDLTAIFAANDKMALGAMHYLSRQGIDVPGQISVIGFDDLPHSAYVWPSLTTVHLPLYEAGALACERLIERIQGTTDRVAETLKTHLVVRDSTAMARSEQTVKSTRK